MPHFQHACRLQLSERSHGQKHLKAGRPSKAIEFLERAMAVLNIVRGQQPADQEEIDANKVSAWVCLQMNDALKETGALMLQALGSNRCNSPSPEVLSGPSPHRQWISLAALSMQMPDNAVQVTTQSRG